MPIPPHIAHWLPGTGLVSVLPLRQRRRPNRQHYPHAISVHGMACADVLPDDVIIFPVQLYIPSNIVLIFVSSLSVFGDIVCAFTPAYTCPSS